MPRFQYHADDAEGRPISGEIDSDNLETAREALIGHSLSVRDLRPVTPLRGTLTDAEALILTQQLGAATNSNLPVVGALRAYSEELSYFSDFQVWHRTWLYRFLRWMGLNRGSRALQQRLDHVCTALEAGEPAEIVLANPALRLPPSVMVILKSGLPHAAMTGMLTRVMRTAASAAELRARTVLLLSYPLLMVIAIGSFWLFLLLYVTNLFAQIFSDFGVPISAFLGQLIHLSKVLQSWQIVYVVPIVLAVPALCLLLLLCLSGTTRWRLWCGIPIIGAMYRLTSLSELARLLAVMLENRVPLPTALTWCAEGIRDMDLQSCCRQVSASLQQGDDVGTACQRVRYLPAHLEQMLHWASEGESGSEPLKSMADMLEIRARTLSAAAIPLFEPLLLTLGVVSVIGYSLTVFPPLIKLLNDLS